jgi:hypothetical protein
LKEEEKKRGFEIGLPRARAAAPRTRILYRSSRRRCAGTESDECRLSFILRLPFPNAAPAMAARVAQALLILALSLR